MKEYISNHIDYRGMSKTKFNIVASGCGTGKTFWVANDFRKTFPHVKPSEILFVTSRAMIVEQQATGGNITKFNPYRRNIVRMWNGEFDTVDEIEAKGIHIMTYDKIINILKTENTEGLHTLGEIKIIFFDECHTIFSDTFIQDMEMLKVWIRDMINIGNKYMIGLTATPRIIYYNRKKWGMEIHRLNKDVLVNYKAKQLYCTDFNTLHYLLANENIQGKTIVMCYSVKECYDLKEKIPNSAVLISKSNARYMPEMEQIRNYIIENESLPDTYIEVTERDSKSKRPIVSEERELKVLITTSTLREGINLREDSGVKNVAISFTDEMHISQWVGRCRFNVENLIVAETYIRTDNRNGNPYLQQSRQAYRNYMKDVNHTQWFDSIAHLVEHDITEVRRFVLSADERKFTSYINTKWLVPSDLKEEDVDKYRIYKQNDKDEIVKMAVDCRLIDLPNQRITFNRIMRFMQDTLGYIVENGMAYRDSIRFRYKLIVEYDEEFNGRKPEDKPNENEKENI